MKESVGISSSVNCSRQYSASLSEGPPCGVVLEGTDIVQMSGVDFAKHITSCCTLNMPYTVNVRLCLKKREIKRSVYGISQFDEWSKHI